MELAEPSIAQAIDKCVSAGAQSIVIAPYFLSRGRHVQEDIPALVDAAQHQHPGIRCVVAGQLIDSRVQSAVQVRS